MKKLMRVYLDNSFLNRPFDNPYVGLNKLELVNSAMIE
jgi:hypothetical protein